MFYPSILVLPMREDLNHLHPHLVGSNHSIKLAHISFEKRQNSTNLLIEFN
jgi:hypothetical protein